MLQNGINPLFTITDGFMGFGRKKTTVLSGSFLGIKNLFVFRLVNILQEIIAFG